jgi:acetyl-CoA C-acetyltransferase
MGTTFTQGPGDPIPPSFLARYPMPDQFASAEAIAEHWSVTRQDCDRLAVESNTRAAKAWSNGWFDAQIVRAADAWQDECIRATTPDAVAALPTFGPDSVHTAASTSKVADGASAVLMMSSSRAAQLGLRPKAVIVDSVLVGVDPALMLTGPIDATRKLLDRSGIGVDKIDLIEINEAFASVVLAWQLELGVTDARVNPNGGALATGHPLGATGTGLIAKAVHELERIDGSLAVVTMCCGGALGTGTLLARR